MAPRFTAARTVEMDALGAVTTANQGAWLFGYCMLPTAQKQGLLTFKDGTNGTVMWIVQTPTVTDADQVTSVFEHFDPPIEFEDSIYVKFHNVSITYVSCQTKDAR